MTNLAFAMKVYLAVTVALGIVISAVVDLAVFMAAHLLINSFHLLRTRSVRNEKSSAKRLVSNQCVNFLSWAHSILLRSFAMLLPSTKRLVRRSNGSVRVKSISNSKNFQ